jgi:hypothetical protein
MEERIPVPDGATVRQPMLLMDGRSDVRDHQSGYRMADAASESDMDLAVLRDAARLARQNMIDRATNAWRTPTRDASPGDDPARARAIATQLQRERSPSSEDAEERERKYEERKARLSSAWKNPSGVTPAPERIIGVGPKSVVVE